MQSKLRRQTYGLACLAILTAIGLVACANAVDGGSAPTASKAIQNVSLDVGQAHTILLATRFSAAEGETLEFDAESSNTSVATVAIVPDTGALRITAGRTGSAEITVTATDTKERSATQDFTVTVVQTPPAQHGPAGPAGPAGPSRPPLIRRRVRPL